MPNSQRSAVIGNAVELMMAWQAAPDGPPDELVAALDRQLSEHPSGDKVQAGVELVMGMTLLCGSTLALHELETGTPLTDTLQALALQFAQDW